MIYERRVGVLFRGDFCSVFKARFGFCFKKNPMKQQQQNKKTCCIFKMDL